jgi:hypothetical protein
MSQNELDPIAILRGWERYPENLSDVSPRDHLEHCNHRLKKDTQRLFNSNITNVRLHTVLRDRHEEKGTEQRPTLITDTVTDEKLLEEVLIVRNKSVLQLDLSLKPSKKHLTTLGDHYMCVNSS